VTGRAITSDPGILPYIYVVDIDEIRERIEAHGGRVVLAPYPEGDLWVATFSDPAGNVLGVWQQGPR
jgi:predicted enzyme related to lactoylglutathione lyase